MLEAPAGAQRAAAEAGAGLGAMVSWVNTAVEGRAWGRRGGRGPGRCLGERGSEIGMGKRSGGERGRIRWVQGDDTWVPRVGVVVGI
jgi:hypothetical protein